MEPFSAMALLNTKGVASLLGGLGGGVGSTPPAGPSNATSAVYGSGLDTSGYSVNFSGIQSASSSQDKSGGVPGIGLTGVAGGVPWWLWAAGAGLIAWRLRKSKK